MKHVLVLIANRAKTTPDFSLKDLAGSAGRLDVVCRVILTFQDTQIFNQAYVILRGGDPPITLQIKREDTRFKSEQDVAIAIKKALNRESSQFKLIEKDYMDILQDLKNNYDIALLEESGIDILSYNFTVGKYAFILGDDKGFLEEQIINIQKLSDVSISLGAVSYLSSQAIAILDYVISKCL